MIPEKNMKVEFEGFIVDLFLCESGDLGMTIEKAPEHEDNPGIDIFVDKENLHVSGQVFGIDPSSLVPELNYPN
jgi:hypothetical protein